MERKNLQPELPEVVFWDQPPVKTAPAAFGELVHRCTEHFSSLGGKAGLMGHSFGCDIIAGLPVPASGPAVLISPLISIPHAMFNLGNRLQAASPNENLGRALEAAKSAPWPEPMAPELFWSLIAQVASHPLYGRVFWTTQENFESFQKDNEGAPAFDLGEWQSVMQDYLFSNPPTSGITRLEKNRNSLVLLGEADPYLNLETDLPYWYDLFGQEQVFVVKNAGHFPHLEQKKFFIDLLQKKYKI